MKTLHLTNCWHSSSGGIGTFYKALFEAAEQEGHEIRLVVPGESTRVTPAGSFGRIYEIEAPRAPLNPQYRLVLPHRYLFPRTALQRIINDEQPDLVEVSDKYTINYLAGLLRTRRLPGVRARPAVVGTSHERMDENMAAYLSSSEISRRFCDWYMKWIYFPMFDHHTTVSEHTAEELIRASCGHRVRRGVWISPMGVDCETFRPSRRSQAGRQKLLDLAETGEDAVILFYAGRLVPEKNLMLLLETIALLDPSAFRLVIAGSGILRDSLERQCESEGIANVRFLGHVSDRELLADCYSNADIFVHPNPREPYGIAPLEAMASGTPLIAPGTGGLTSYANESNAWLAAPDAASFAATIIAAHLNPGQCRLRSNAARQTAEELSWPVVASRYLQLYRELRAITNGEQRAHSISARTWSTPGDFFGRELINS
jgi:alpha-1,6-mannosyltransferase